MLIVGRNYNKIYQIQPKILQIQAIKKTIVLYKRKNKILKQQIISKWVENWVYHPKVMKVIYKREIKRLNRQKLIKIIINLKNFKRFNRNKYILTKRHPRKFQPMLISQN